MVRATLKVFAIAIAAVVLPNTAQADSELTEFLETAIPHFDQYIPEPSLAARAAAVTFTAAYDAWAAYDDEAVGVVTGDLLDGTGGPDTPGNRREAVLHAMVTAMYGLTGKQNALNQRLLRMGYNPESNTPAAILGRRIGAAVLSNRRQDGSNQPGGYADTSHYMIAPMEEFDAWQPDWDEDEDELQMPMTPHWGRVLPFAVMDVVGMRPPAPPVLGSPEFDAQVQEIIDYSANLTDEQKAIAEYWAPFRWANPTTHLMELTQDISRREGLSFDEDIQLFFAFGNAMLDASIAAWDAKYHYNYVRPVTVIQAMGDEVITAYDERRNQTRQIRARDWEPYLETPPFPEYVSGHSTFAAAWARVMEMVMGTEEFDYTGRVYSINEEDSSRIFNPIELYFPTYRAAAESSGMSRLYGGIHWMAGNREGLNLGYQVGELAVERSRQFIAGDAMTPTPVFASVETQYWMPMSEGGIMTEAMDAQPVGNYYISASVISADPSRERVPLRINVRAADGTDRILGSVDESHRSERRQWIGINWRSTGHERFYITIEPAAEIGADYADYEVVQIYQVRVN